MDPLSLIVGVVTGIFIVGVVQTLFRLLLPWRRAMLHATGIGLMHIVGMLLRGNPPGVIVDAVIILRTQGVKDITPHLVETVYTTNQHTITDAESLTQLVREQQGIDA